MIKNVVEYELIISIGNLLFGFLANHWVFLAKEWNSGFALVISKLLSVNLFSSIFFTPSVPFTVLGVLLFFNNIWQDAGIWTHVASTAVRCATNELIRSFLKQWEQIAPVAF